MSSEDPSWVSEGVDLLIVYLACEILEKRSKSWSQVEIEEVDGLFETYLLPDTECLGISMLVVDEDDALKLINLLNLIWTIPEANYRMFAIVILVLLVLLQEVSNFLKV